MKQYEMKQKKLYSQTEIADLIGISKATVSRYINKNNVAGTKQKNAKLYPETVIQQIKRAYQPHKSKNKKHISVIQLLQQQITQLQDENKSLKEQLKTKDDLLKNQLAIKDQQIAKTNDLADQAQKLNLLDKPKSINNKSTLKKKKHWWQ